MNEQLKNIKFSTKSIMITDRQKDTISDLIDQLMDNGCFDYQDLEYWKLSKQEASKLIQELINKNDDMMLNAYYECDDYIDITDYGDR